MTPPPKLIRYLDARPLIADGDLLLFRRRSLISIAGRGTHSHAAKALWWNEDLFCVEVRELRGGRAVLLSREVRCRPGVIDVYETNPRKRWDYKRDAAAKYMRRLSGCRYGYGGILRAAALHLPFVRWVASVDVDDETIDKNPPFCSQACAMADRIGGGVDPVPHLADRLTEPADLARSPFYRYRFTLIP